MKLRHLTFFIFLMCTGSVFSQQGIKSIRVDIEYYTEKEVKLDLFNSAEDLYQLKLLSGKYKDLEFQFRARMEDELNSEESYVLFSEVAFFDMQFSYQIGPVGVSWAIENLLGFNSPAFAIEASLERDYGVIDTVNFAHEADFLISTALTYNF